MCVPLAFLLILLLAPPVCVLFGVAAGGWLFHCGRMAKNPLDVREAFRPARKPEEPKPAARPRPAVSA